MKSMWIKFGISVWEGSRESLEDNIKGSGSNKKEEDIDIVLYHCLIEFLTQCHSQNIKFVKLFFYPFVFI